jgi:hypothetical protein
MLDFGNDLPNNRFVGRARKHSMDDDILSPKRFAVPWLQCHPCPGSLISHSQTWAGRLSLPTLPASLQPLYRDDFLRQQPRSASARLVVTRHLQRRTIHRACPGVVALTPMCPSLAQAHSGECVCDVESSGTDRRRHGNRRDVSERGGKKAKSTAAHSTHRVVEPTSDEVTAAMKMTDRRWLVRLADKVGNVACGCASIQTARH